MGYGTYSDAAYHNRAQSRLQANYSVSRTMRSQDIQEGRAAPTVAPRLDPRGLRIRESRDSAAHPETVAAAIFFDVTGSMGQIPVVLRQKLNALMGLLVSRGYLLHPHVLFGAIGDATCDSAPLQVGQFEADIQMDEDLDAIWTEGGGGGHNRETYELAHYVAARHTAIDCWDRRQHKGYLFTMGDEAPYPAVRRDHVRALIGNEIEADVPTADIVRECQQRYHVFHLIVTEGGAFRQAGPEIARQWEEVLPGGVIRLADHTHVAETVATIIGLTEGAVDMDGALENLRALGLDADAIAAIRRATQPVAERALRIRAEA